MKQLRITEKEKKSLLKKLLEKFEKEMNTYEDNINDSTIKFEFKFSEECKQKVVLYYTPQAYLKMMALVDHYDTEVGWYGLAEKHSSKEFLVYDVRMCRQIVSGAKVDTTDEDTLNFFDSLNDEDLDHLKFQGHSHVRMSTEASGIDLQNQADVVRNMGKDGFYIFQIWNKNGDINTYLYDLDENKFYDRKDIITDIWLGEGPLSEFTTASEKLVVEQKYTPTITRGYWETNKTYKSPSSYWGSDDYAKGWGWE